MQKNHTLFQIDMCTAINHITNKEPAFKPIIKIAPPIKPSKNQNISIFAALLEAIIFQQLTAKAASTIYQRLCTSFSNNTPPTPLDILRATEEDLKSIGLSTNKASAAQSLAEHIQCGLIPQRNELEKLSNNQIVKTLTQIKGIGEWTAEMLLIFYFHRADVFSKNDYALQKGYAIITKKFPMVICAQSILEISYKWRPYRTIAAWYLWRTLDIYYAQSKDKLIKKSA